MTEFAGGCLCGAVRYAVSGEPVRIAQCHCDDCRRATGSTFATNVFVRKEDLTILQGTTKSYSHAADSGNTMTKEFCPECGSQLFGWSSGGAGVRSVKVGSIDDAGFVQPQSRFSFPGRCPAPGTPRRRKIRAYAPAAEIAAGRGR